MKIFLCHIENISNSCECLDGGNSDSEAVSCSGGRRDDGCWSARLMWRTNGAGELYTYLPPDFTENQAVCDIPPFSTCNDVYGASVGRGSFTWKTGARTTVSQRVRLNDVGQANGELELFVAGKSVVNVGGLVLRNSADGRIRGMQFQTFFGGRWYLVSCLMRSHRNLSYLSPQVPTPPGPRLQIKTHTFPTFLLR